MLSVSLKDFLKLNDVRFVNVSDKKFKARHVKGISIDSRTIEPDQIFWAIKGEHFDGHDFVREANSKSALCSVISASHFDELNDIDIPLIVVPDALKALQQIATIQRNKYKIPVIAITGSNGKTTTKEMIAHILQTKVNTHKTKGNQNNQIGCPLTMLLLSEMHEAAILELGSNHFGEIKTLTQMVEPSHALITLIGEAHLEFFKNIEGVAREKLDLFDNLVEGSTIYKNLDDPYIKKYNRKNMRYVTFSFEEDADVMGAFGEVNENACGTLILNGDTEVKLKTPGVHNVKNALAAAAVAMDLGFTKKEVAKALGSFSSFEKRMQIVKWKNATIVNDTYNASPVSMRVAIDTIMGIKHKGNVILAIGDMNELGKDSHKMHVESIKYALSKNANKIILIGNKMHKAAKDIDKQKSILKCNSLKEVADVLTTELKDGDILLLKGSRSMQMEKVMAFLPQ